jgi:hypothetical protein
MKEMTTTIIANQDVGMKRICYHAINICFGTIILGIFFYSLLFRGGNHPIPAILTDLTGLIPPSKGLSAGFSELVRGNIETALMLNPYSLRIFSFFLIQLLSRGLFSIAIEGNWIKMNRIVLIDAIFSTSLFVFCFAPLISYSISLFSKLI